MCGTSEIDKRCRYCGEKLLAEASTFGLLMWCRHTECARREIEEMEGYKLGLPKGR